MAEAVNNPAHYGGKNNPYEAIKVIRAWGLNFNTGNAAKYISRAGKKDPAKEIEDLEKAVWYLNDEIAHLKAQQGQQITVAYHTDRNSGLTFAQGKDDQS